MSSILPLYSEVIKAVELPVMLSLALYMLCQHEYALLPSQCIARWISRESLAILLDPVLLRTFVFRADPPTLSVSLSKNLHSMVRLLVRRYLGPATSRIASECCGDATLPRL